MNIVGLPALIDTYENYIWVISQQHLAWIIDPGESQPVIDYLTEHQLEPQAILITHQHHDHINGIAGLIEQFPKLDVYTPQNSRIAQATQQCREGDTIHLHPELSFKVLNTPGHTPEHIAFYNDELLFCGDTLFAAGCGRILGGTPEEFAKSILKLRNLTDQLDFYSAHEYTHTNLKFASLVEPENKLIEERLRAFQSDYPAVLETPQSTLQLEKATNPFLRFDLSPLKEKLLQRGATDNPTSLFKTLREWKDEFDRAH